MSVAPAVHGIANVDDLRLLARRRLPRIVFDFVDGAAGAEWTSRANREAFNRLCFRPSPLVDVSGVDQRVNVFGEELSTPVLLGPAGAASLVHPEGELGVARAAASAGTIYVAATGANRTVEEIADAGRGGAQWLQIYLWRDRRFVQSLVERAASSGYKALCLTVDSVVAHGRDRDIRNGLNFPPRVTVRDALDVTRHPRWLWGYLRERPVHLKNLDVDFRSRDALAVPQLVKQLKNLTATWDELRWLRRVWDGPIVVKGILTAEAASAAFDHGADGVICSNHGGRELDGVTPSFLALPRVVEEAVARRKEVFLDSGVRRGSDVVKALALGARACLIARPYYWGLAVAGEAGVLQVCDVLRREIESVLGNLGRPTLEGLDASAVEWLPATGPLRP